MTLLQRIEFIRTELYHSLNEWEKEFVSDIFEGVDGLPSHTTDEELKDYLTPRQIDKIEEIWMGQGL